MNLVVGCPSQVIVFANDLKNSNTVEKYVTNPGAVQTNVYSWTTPTIVAIPTWCQIVKIAVVNEKVDGTG
jgi:hypothetical protein